MTKAERKKLEELVAALDTFLAHPERFQQVAPGEYESVSNHKMKAFDVPWPEKGWEKKRNDRAGKT